ncbi:potassium/sodium hyperpolarization-activated cyclic nucleotide-gated channel 2-like [Lagenorhynchus albirostris]|uniref:potassium/sodium hyperpolarization-activated cyclic nucleotide-gated channel 2-like n=1 Tax=Lagenorhynchus albirostris TaxID=27610 RepID=UPI0028E82364|nr:potassium/sodium hyperpolarization-activated cyclic nucleotide-gated channel 2-like [Lagenorhynchus albirostris]
MGVTAPGTSGNKTQRRPRGGRCGGEGPGTKPARADPRSPPPQRPHSPALDSAPSPPPAVQSRLKTAAPRAPRAASLPSRPVADCLRDASCPVSVDRLKRRPIMHCDGG